MNRVLAALALGGVIATAVIVVIDEKSPEAGDVVIEPSKLALLPDGGKGYVERVKQIDGGIALRVKASGGCVRRPVGNKSCLKGGRDPGDLNRFPAAEATGSGCEPVACSIVFGEDPDLAEDDVIRDAKKPREGAGK